MPLNKPFQHQPTSITSYDWTDVDNTGVILFTGHVTETSAGLDYHLTKDETVYSTKIDSGSTAISSSLDFDFDLPVFNSPQTIRGNAIVSFTVQIASAATLCNCAPIIYIRKWDGTSETPIVTVTGPTISTTIAAVNELMTVPLTIPKTHFKKGETLRLAIVATTITAPPGGQTSTRLGHDPRNRDGTWITPSTDDPDTITKLLFYCPFDQDL